MARHHPNIASNYKMYAGHAWQCVSSSYPLPFHWIYDPVDGPLPIQVNVLVRLSILMAGQFCSIIYFSPAFLLPGLLVSLAGASCGAVYLKAQLPIKRVQSNAKAPVLAQWVLSAFLPFAFISEMEWQFWNGYDRTRYLFKWLYINIWLNVFLQQFQYGHTVYNTVSLRNPSHESTTIPGLLVYSGILTVGLTFD